MSHAMWLKSLVNPDDLERICKLLADEINSDKHKIQINAIAVIGVSGCVIGGVVSFLTGIPLIIVRKDENRHSKYDVEFSESLKNIDTLHYIFIDDLIATGSTLRNVQKKIQSKFDDIVLEKMYLYNQNKDHLDRSIQYELKEHYPYFQIDADYY